VERGATEREPADFVDLAEKLEAAQESDVVEQALAAAQQRLNMDASYITTIDSRNQTIHATFGEEDVAARVRGRVFPVEQTYCMRMLNGEIPNVVPDTRREPAISELAATQVFHAYVGVPIKLADGRVHGTLCCVSREPREDLGPEELRFMQILAGIVATRLDRARGDLARLTERFRRSPAPSAEAGMPSEYADAVRRIKAARESDIIDRALSAAREQLHMDAAYIATVDSREQTIEAMIGTTNADVLVEGAVIPVEETYCARMLSGEIPNIVPDTGAEPALRKITVIRNIGAYIGVPVKLSDGRVHGSLCCASNEPRAGLGEPELRFMRVLADIVAAQIERTQGSMVRLAKRLSATEPSP
jgi:GAF domain-containing protein